ncbi:MAG: ATP-dependent zinc protease [Gammaproteobacteria bacterium]
MPQRRRSTTVFYPKLLEVQRFSTGFRGAVAIIRRTFFSSSETFLMRKSFLVVLAALLGTPAASLAGAQEDFRVLEVFGWVERVKLLDGKLSVKAKLDTGAATSSLDASNIERFKRGGRSWVRFLVTDPATGETLEIEKPVVRNVRIIRHDDESQRRPVVKLDVCFGPFLREVEFSLVDRSNFIYPVLLGRNALENFALVDAGATFLNYPSCDRAAPGDARSGDP